MSRPVIVAPSILSADFGRLAEEVRAVDNAGADWIHVDVMDGRFVPNITIGPVVVEAVRKATAKPVDVHLMIVEPERYLDDFAKAGADHLLVHCEPSSTIHLQLLAEMLPKIRALRRLCDEQGLDPVIEVDGGLGGENAWQVIDAGANAIVAGSHVFHASDYAQAIAAIRNTARPRS